ncbi:MAG TPA: DUF3627 domain-containing protein [Nitrosarchaeum sp.]|nr:DUF3627 domain-containing protein [Nitrosarchaeum sp.]
MCTLFWFRIRSASALFDTRRSLVVYITSWISPKFAVKVSQIVNEYLVSEYKKTIEKKNVKIGKLEEKLDKIIEQNDVLIAKNDKLLNKNKKMSKKIDNPTNQNDELLEKNDVMIDKLDNVCNDRVVRPKSKDDTHSFIIIRNDAELYPYHAIRRLYKDAGGVVRRYINSHGEKNTEVVLYINYTPNAINLFSRVKETLSDEGKIKFKGNDIKLRGKYTEEEFISTMRDVHNERFDY